MNFLYEGILTGGQGTRSSRLKRRGCPSAWVLISRRFLTALLFLTAQSSLDLRREDFFRPMPLLLPIHPPGLNQEEINSLL
jgi:hypothetical protein